jgi:hypothetical protein
MNNLVQHSELMSPRLAKSRAVKLLLMRGTSNHYGSPFSRFKSRVFPEPELDGKEDGEGYLEAGHMHDRSRPMPRRAFSNDTRRKYHDERENSMPRSVSSKETRMKTMDKGGHNAEGIAVSNEPKHCGERVKALPQRAYSNENRKPKYSYESSKLEDDALGSMQNRSMSES